MQAEVPGAEAGQSRWQRVLELSAKPGRPKRWLHRLQCPLEKLAFCSLCSKAILGVWLDSERVWPQVRGGVAFKDAAARRPFARLLMSSKEIN